MIYPGAYTSCNEAKSKFLCHWLYIWVKHCLLRCHKLLTNTDSLDTTNEGYHDMSLVAQCMCPKRCDMPLEWLMEHYTSHSTSHALCLIILSFFSTKVFRLFGVAVFIIPVTVDAERYYIINYIVFWKEEHFGLSNQLGTYAFTLESKFYYNAKIVGYSLQRVLRHWNSYYRLSVG